MFIALALAALATQDLSEETFDKTFKSILPQESEQAWRKIAWRPVLWDAVTEAQEKDMPVLFWGMNGHPMACT